MNPQDRNRNLPEPPEPREERGFIPVSLIALLAILAFLGDMYLVNNGLDVGGKDGAFPDVVYFPFQDYAAVAYANPPTGGVDLDMGKRVYSASCSPCHQPTGLGTPGMFPPLAGSEWVTTEGHGRLIRIVLNGLAGPITVSGQQYNNVMVPWRDTLTDEQIAAVLSYVRNEWGNKGSFVTPEEVKKVRAETQDKSGNWTAEELKALPE